MTDARTSLYFQGFPGIVYISGGGIHPAALMVSAGAKKSRRAGGAGSAFRR